MTDNTEREARAEAYKRYDSDRIIDDNTGEEVSHDDWGYADAERQAFVAGALWMRENGYEKRERVADARNPFDAMDEAFREHDAPSWDADEMARDAAIRWHQRGFLDGLKFAAKREPVVVDDATEWEYGLTWEPYVTGDGVGPQVCSGCETEEGAREVGRRLATSAQTATVWRRPVRPAVQRVPVGPWTALAPDGQEKNR